MKCIHIFNFLCAPFFWKARITIHFSVRQRNIREKKCLLILVWSEVSNLCLWILLSHVDSTIYNFWALLLRNLIELVSCVISCPDLKLFIFCRQTLIVLRRSLCFCCHFSIIVLKWQGYSVFNEFPKFAFCVQPFDPDRASKSSVTWRLDWGLGQYGRSLIWARWG